MDRKRALNAVLWIVQVLLAILFLAAGAMKSTQPIDALIANGLAWVSVTPAPIVRLIGVSELLGAAGLLLPAALRILPWLTPLAAAALATVMVLAMGLHLSYNEVSALPVNLVIGLLAGFVVWDRTMAVPIAPRAQTS